MTTLPDPLSQALAGQYRLDREIGRGGTATVYLADDLKHARRVAIKVLRPELSSGVGADRFLREIEFASRLNHPRILPLHDSGQARGALYYVMPYVEGESLRQRLDREKQLPVDDALRIAREVAEALDYANSQGIVHRDVKPDNIFLTPGGAVVADFGIARALEEAGGEKLTRTGIAIGTPAYMPPEQVGEDVGLDGRADQYSLACVLYEMLVGEPPFTGPTPQVVLNRHATAPVPPITSARPAVPEAIERVVAKALAKTPADRFKRTRRLAQALEVAASGVTSGDVKAGDVPPANGSDSFSSPSSDSGPRPVAFVGVLALVGAMALTWIVLLLRPAPQVLDVSAPALDASVVAIAPFEVIGTDPDFQTAGDQALELLSQVLDRGSELHVVDPGKAFGVPADAAGDPGDRSLATQLEVARSVGAGLLIRGALLGTSDEMTISASLISVFGGGVERQGRVEGSLSELPSLVTRLAVRLFVPTEGALPVERLTKIGNEALEEYLAGVRAHRAERTREAYRHFTRAVSLDSTFDEAAVRRVMTAHRCCQQSAEWFEAADAAHARLNQFSDRHRAQVIYTIGPDYPGGWATGGDLIRATEAAIDAGVRDPYVYEYLGRRLYRFGAPTGYPDWAQGAANALDRAIELGGPPAKSRVLVLRFVVERHLRSPVPGRLEKLRDSVLRAGPSDLERFVVSAAVDDVSALRRLEGSAGEGESKAFWLSVAAHEGFDPSVPEAAIHAMRGRGVTREDRLAAVRAQSSLAMVQGQAARAAVLLDSLFQSSYQPQALEEVLYYAMPFEHRQSPLVWLGFPIWQALIEPGYGGAATRGAERIDGLVELEPVTGDEILARHCDRELWRVHNGDTTSTRASIARLWKLYSSIGWHGVCPTLLEALLEEQTLGDGYSRTGAPALERLDSLMQQFPREPLNVETLLIIGRLREKRGEPDAALAAARRLGHYPRFMHAAPAFYRLHGRLAAEMGDTAAARLSFSRYLRLRERHGELLKAQVDSVRNELSDLTTG